FVVVPMSRQHQRGFQSKVTERRRAVPLLSLFLPVGFGKLSYLLALCLSLFLLNNALPVAFAQDPDVEDVHVAPRVDPQPDQTDDLQKDTVRMHAPMLKSKVDLVLVPVTVTDPMNRLV